VIEKLKNPFTDNYFELKETVLNRFFPWYFYSSTLGNEEEADFPFFSHIVVSRPLSGWLVPEIQSPHFELTHTVVKEIFKANNISADCIYRMNFNLTYNQQSDDKSPWHVDHDFNHKVLLVYLTKFSGGETAVDVGNKIYLSEPKEDKIITFDGTYKHCAYQPKENERRVVLNCTYLG